MRVDPFLLPTDSTAPDALLGRIKGKPRLDVDEPEKRLRDRRPVQGLQKVGGLSDRQGELKDELGLTDDIEQPTKKPLRAAHKQSRFHVKTFLSRAGTGRTILYAPGKQILFEQGKRGNAVFYILAGTVKLSVVSQGKETTIGLLGPGNFAGKECIATVRPRRTASARALTNCTIVRIARKEMLRVIQHEKTFTAFFLDYLLACIGHSQEVIVDQLVVPQIHQEELAEMVGTTRSRISFFLNRFRKLGFIAYKGQSSITISTAKLARFVMA